jgi:Mrp family chromosome partitioning ATPase/capsular polysaccharide biosynthesis protein
MSEQHRQLTLRDYLVPIRERLWLILVIVALITGAVYVYETRQTQTYTVSTKVYVGQSSDAALGIPANSVSPESLTDEATLLTSTEVATIVAQRIGFTRGGAALAGSVAATPSTDSDFIAITAQESSPRLAARVANAFAQEFIKRNNRQQLSSANKALATLRHQLGALPHTPANETARASIQNQIQDVQVTASSGVGNVTQIDVAQPPGASSRRSPFEYAGLALIAALIGSILLAYLLYRLDPSLKTVEQAGDLYQVPVLATVPHDRNILHFVDGKPALSPRSMEAFRNLRISLDLAAPGERFATILITSASPGEGKSTVSRNLALALAEAGRAVALVEADLRKPGLPKKLGVTAHEGVTTVLAGLTPLAGAMIQVPVAAQPIPGLADFTARTGRPVPGLMDTLATIDVIPAGPTPPNPSAVLESAAFRSLLAEIRNDHDVVVIDSTPIGTVSDAIPLLGRVNAVVLVARSESTDRRSARHAADIIARVPGANIIGVVVNDVSVTEASAYGSSGYGYGYGYGSSKAKRGKASSGGISLAAVVNDAAEDVESDRDATSGSEAAVEAES